MFTSGLRAAFQTGAAPLTLQMVSRGPPPLESRAQRFFAGYSWLILKNLIGWPLILTSFVAGPLVPGPGGIVLFLIGFALVTFPGKRKLTARVLRGRRIRLRGRSLMLAIVGLALIVPALVLMLEVHHLQWLPSGFSDSPSRGLASYLAGVVVTGLAACGAVLLLNLLLRAMPPIRRRVRPWLRRHRIHLLPPRRRHRLPHEHGSGPFHLKDEILSFLKRT